MADTQPALPGLDLTRLRAWFARAVPDAPAGSLTAELITGGRSNLTYEVSDGSRSWIVRRPPLGHVLATAHDMAREYRVISALWHTDVPVPRAVAFCADATVLGAPFYVMERVAGTPYRHAAELALLGPRRTRTISTALVDTLAGLHEVDPAAAHLSDFGRPDGFLARQVERWKKQLDASRSRDLPGAEHLYARLAGNVPAQSAPGIVHGDYRLDNVLIDDRDRPVAIIDWEMATLGDPLTDLALLVLYQRLARILPGNVADASSAPGFLTEVEMLDRYARHSNRDLSRFGYYLALASFKAAGILEGIHYRFLRGQTVGPGFDQVGAATVLVVEIGLSALDDGT